MIRIALTLALLFTASEARADSDEVSLAALDNKEGETSTASSSQSPFECALMLEQLLN